MTAPDRARRATTPALPSARRARRKLLLVEDEAALAQVLARLLEPACQVSIAPHGGAALRAIEEGSPPFDVVLSDVHMPSMDGIELHRALAARGSPLARRFVLMSGAPLSAAHRAYLPTGVLLLSKPFELAELERALDATLAAAERA